LVGPEEQLKGYSLDVQRRAAQALCAERGWEAVAEYADEGRPARYEDLNRRPRLKAMIEAAESHQVDVVLVHKLDRFARNLRVTLDTLERLERCRVAFASIAENMDFTSPIGKVILATLAAFAQYYSDNLSWETRKGKQERKEQGLCNGLLPFGLKKNADGQAVPDPTTYPGLLLAYRLAAEGKSDREVANALNTAGYRTTGNRSRNLFTKDTVRPILVNRFYLGELPDGPGGWRSGAHAVVLDAELFDEAQRVRALNRTGSAKVATSIRRYSLSLCAPTSRRSSRSSETTTPRTLWVRGVNGQVLTKRK
jgi:DNA invertase Pin-like site-specific DNA recombinase